MADGRMATGSDRHHGAASDRRELRPAVGPTQRRGVAKGVLLAALGALSIVATIVVATSLAVRTRHERRSPELHQLEQRVATLEAASGAAMQPADERISAAEDAARAGTYGKALRLCQEVLQWEPRNPRALLTCAISSCALQRVAPARRYFALLRGKAQAAVRQICLRRRVAVDGSDEPWAGDLDEDDGLNE